jgi:hypothetical protein
LQKLLNLRDSNRLTGVFITGESITNTDNFKFKIVSGHAYWEQETLFDEKNRDKKSRDTVPLREKKKIFPDYMSLNHFRQIKSWCQMKSLETALLTYFQRKSC